MEANTQKPSPGIPFFFPQSNAPLGTVTPSSTTPKVFTPLTIKNMIIPNRVGMSPMVSYSCAPTGPLIGVPSIAHFAHYAAVATRGVGLIIVEACSITPEARCSPHDAGLWTDEQALEWKKLVDYAHSQGVKIGVQLGHGGRKTSTRPLSMPDPLHPVGSEYYGWADDKSKVLGPSEISWSEDLEYPVPTAITKAQIKELVGHYKTATKRAYDIAGFDFVEIHAAHGYLLNSFLSGLSNKRTDEFGGSFANRIRFLLEIIDEVKDDLHPLFVRISADELSPDEPDAWTLEESIMLCHEMAKHGVDVVDVSSGGNNSKAPRRSKVSGYQVSLAQAIKASVGDSLLVASVGKLNTSEIASMVVENGSADIVLVGTKLLQNPGLVWQWAVELGVKLQVGRTVGWPYGIY